jgi:hypothetical protein
MFIGDKSHDPIVELVVSLQRFCYADTRLPGTVDEYVDRFHTSAGNTFIGLLYKNAREDHQEHVQEEDGNEGHIACRKLWIKTFNHLHSDEGEQISHHQCIEDAHQIGKGGEPQDPAKGTEGNEKNGIEEDEQQGERNPVSSHLGSEAAETISYQVD